MPVFNLELKFDDKGALQAVTQMNKVSEAADDASKAIDQLGKNGPKNIDKVTDSALDASKAIDEFGKNGKDSVSKVTDTAKEATKAIDSLGNTTGQAVNQIDKISVTVDGVSRSIDSLGGKSKEALDQINNISSEANRAAQAVNKLGKSGTTNSQALADSAKSAQNSLGNTGKSGEKALGGISKNAELAKKSINLLGKGLQIFARVGIPASLALGIMNLVSSSKELKEQLEGLEKQYQTLGSRAGWTAQEMAGLEKLMIQNGVSAVNARKNVIALTSAYIESSKAPALLATALDATVISGKSVDDTLRSITQAIESGNVKSLEALGIYANFTAAYENMAAKIGTTVGALTEQERAQARVDATLQAATANAGLFEGALTDMERAQNSMNESLTELKMEIADAFGFESADMVYALAKAVKWLADVVNNAKTSFRGLGAVIKGELSLAQYFAMDSTQIKEHLEKGLDEKFVRQQLDRVNKVIEERSTIISPFGDPELEKALGARAEYQRQLEKIQKKAQNDQAKANIAERQQQVKHEQDMAELQERSRQNELLRQSKTREGRIALAEKGAKDQLAIEKRLYENGKITQEEYKKRSLSIEKDKQEKLKAIEKYYSGKRGDASTGGGGASGKADAAIKQLENYTRQIDILNGTSSRAAQQLEKILEGIESTGRAAGLSASEIEKIKTEYTEAFKADVLTKFDKELLKVQGNTAALKEIEIAEKMQEWNAQFIALGISAAEATPKLQAMQEALAKQKKVEDLQSTVSFLKDLESLGGSYGLTIQKQNELLEYQAALYREKLPSDMQPYIDQWERLKKLENDKSFMGGLERGVKKFGEQYGDLAASVEGFTAQMGSTISSTLSSAFMSGKFSAQDFFQSLVSMAAQAASNYFIGMLFKGLFSAAGSAAGSYNGLNSSAAAGAANTSGYSVNMGMRWSGASAKGNVFSGGNLGDYSGQIVSRPTFFAYGTHLTAYAKGAGLMGEKGPEAILPLARMSNGDLGVQYKIDSGYYTQKTDFSGYARIMSELISKMDDHRQNISNAPIINLTIENNANADVQAGQVTPDGKGGWNMQVIISQIEQGVVGRAKQGKSQIMKYQQATYGLDRAGVIARSKGRN